MPKTSDPRRHWLLVSQWPEKDQAIWQAATAACDEYGFANYGQHLAPESLASLERTYGRFLNFLRCEGELDPDEHPADRVTPARLATYLSEIRRMYMSASQTLLISGIACAMRIFAPNRDWDWIWTPNGTSLAPWLRGPRTTFDVPASDELFKWGLELMMEADKLAGRSRLTAFRDGLMIAILAARPMRRRTMFRLEVNKHLLRNGPRWRIILDAADVKNRRVLEFDLPESLTPGIERYLGEIRPELLRGADSSALWIATYGRPMALTAIGLMIRVRARKRFGVEFGPHRFRHALETTATIRCSDQSGLTAPVLWISHRMLKKHYDRAESHVAANGYHAALEAERANLEGRARRAFEELAGTGGSKPAPLEDAPAGVVSGPEIGKGSIMGGERMI